MRNNSSTSRQGPKYSLDDLPVWRFAMQLYAKPGVKDSLIALQDQYSLDVSLFLFLLHLVFVEGRLPDPAGLAALKAFIADWRAQIVMPLRQVRRAMKIEGSGFVQTVSRALRKEISNIEIKSEKIEIALCHQWAEDFLPPAVSSELSIAMLWSLASAAADYPPVTALPHEADKLFAVIATTVDTVAPGQRSP